MVWWAAVLENGGAFTLDSVGVDRMGDLVGVRLPSTQGDNSMALLGSLKMGRLGESPVNLSMISGSWSKKRALNKSPRSLVVQLSG